MLNLRTTFALSLLAMAPLASIAQTVLGVPEGSYRGRFVGAGRGRVHLISTPIPGCGGCFMATIIKRKHTGFLGLGEIDRTIEIYKALPIGSPVYVNNPKGLQWKHQYVSGADFALIPIRVASDGELAPTDPNPSKRLVIERDPGTAEVQFSVGDAGSKNKDGFKSAMMFSGYESPFEDDDADSGRLRTRWSNRIYGSIGMVTKLPEDGVTRIARVIAYGARSESESPNNMIDGSGSFQVEEKAPNVFTFTQLKLAEDGEELNPIPSKLILFLNIGGKQRVFLINPDNSSDIQEIKIKQE